MIYLILFDLDIYSTVYAWIFPASEKTVSELSGGMWVPRHFFAAAPSCLSRAFLMLKQVCGVATVVNILIHTPQFETFSFTAVK